METKITKLSAEQIQSAIERAKDFIATSKGRESREWLVCSALLDMYGRLQEADQDRLLRIFDQYAVECGNCGCALIARGGSLGEHYGLAAKDSGSEDEQLCGYCAGLELADASAKLRDLDIANDQLITDETVLRAELTEARRQLDIARKDMRDVAAETKRVVRCGCLGCLTDDCDHWGVDCHSKDYTLCHIGRTIENTITPTEKPATAGRTGYMVSPTETQL